MSLQDDWKVYIESPSAFEIDHFEMLLFEEGAIESADELFDTLPSGASIAARLRQLSSEWSTGRAYYVGQGRSTQEVQIHRLQTFLSSLADFAADEGMPDEARQLRNGPIRVILDRSKFDSLSLQRDLRRNEIPDLVGDIELERIEKVDERFFAVHAAVLQLTKFPNVTSWILSEALDMPIQFEPAYAFHRDGGRMVLAEHETFISFMPTT